MKKILIASIVAMAFTGLAADFSSASLLSGTELYVPDNTTITPTTTNAYYSKLDGTTYTYSFTSTNVLLMVTNGVTGEGTNKTVVNTNFVSGSAFAVAPIAALADGGINSNATLLFNGYASGAGETNVFTVTFERSTDGVNFDSASAPMVLTATVNSTAGTTMVTNVPAAVLTGVKYLRVKSVVTADHASNGAHYIRLSLNQWVP